MSEVTIRRIRRTITEVAVPSPTDWSQITRALAAVKKHAELVGIDMTYDDAVFVRGDDDEIVFWFEVPVIEDGTFD